MPYDRMNLKDGDRWYAKHVSHLEDGIVQNESDISVNASGLASEIETREQKEASIRADLAKETEDRASAVSTVEEKLGAEVYDRRTADNKLEETFTQKTSEIESDLLDVQKNISAEITHREEAISEVTARLDSTDQSLAKEISDRKTAIDEVKNLISDTGSSVQAETEARVAADAVLQANIDSEADTRSEADAALQNNIDLANTAIADETSARETAIKDVISKIQAETEARVAADAVLQANIDSETDTRSEADAALQNNIDLANTAIADETSARETAIKDVISKIQAETAERESDTEVAMDAIELLQKNLDTETAARTDADTELKELIGTETSERKSAISAIEESITDVKDTYVKKVTGKDLSDENFTAELKTKLEGIESGAQVNVLESVSVNGTKLTPSSKGVDVIVPTKVSSLENDADYAVKATTLSGYGIADAYTKTEVDNKLVSIMTYKGSKETYEDLPAEGNVVGDVWNVTADDHNYAWNGTSWDDLGGTVDFSSYYTKTQVDGFLDTKVDKVAGKGLSDENFTADLKTKLEEIEAGAQVNVQSDWNADSGDAQILNKPAALKNPNSLTMGKKSYDGSAAVTLEASDLGALTEIPVATADVLGGVKAGGAGLSIDSETGVVGIANSITAGTVSGTAGQLDFGGKLSIPSVTYDANGLITKTEVTEAILPSLVIDSEMSDTSENPVQNKVVNAAISNEATARESGDTALDTKISDLEVKVDANTELIKDVESQIQGDLPNTIKNTLEAGYLKMKCTLGSVVVPSEGDNLTLTALTEDQVSHTDSYILQCDIETSTSEDSYILTCNI